MMHRIAYELHMPIEAVENMPPWTYAKWVAFFKIQDAQEKKAAAKRAKLARRRRS